VVRLLLVCMVLFLRFTFIFFIICFIYAHCHITIYKLGMNPKHIILFLRKSSILPLLRFALWVHTFIPFLIFFYPYPFNLFFSSCFFIKIKMKKTLKFKHIILTYSVFCCIIRHKQKTIWWHMNQ